MDEFINTLDRSLFESTNYIWNSLKLNDPWGVGYVTALIEQKQFSSKEEWENYYYESGEKRNSEILKLPKDVRDLLDNESIILTDKKRIGELESDILKYNYYYGRTRDQLLKKGRILFTKALATKIEISEQQCVEAVRFRTICQTWNGVVVRERNTIDRLKSLLKDMQFIKASGEMD